MKFPLSFAPRQNTPFPIPTIMQKKLRREAWIFFWLYLLVAMCGKGRTKDGGKEWGGGVSAGEESKLRQRRSFCRRWGGRESGVASGENSYELLFHGCGGGATGDPGEERTARTRRGEAWLCPEGGRKGEKEEGKQ